MDLINTLKNAAQRGLNMVQGGGMMSAPRPTAAPAAISTGVWLPTNLDPKDFKAGNWRANEWSNVAYFKCDETARYQLIGGAPVSIYIRSFAGYTVATPGVRSRILTDLIDGSLGTFTDEVIVWHRVGTVWTQGVVSSVVYDPSGIGGTVTYTEPVGAVETELYYLAGSGEFRFRAIRALGGFDNSATLLWNESFNAIHTVNQRSNRSSPLWGRDFELVPGYTLALEVKTPSQVKFSARARHILSIRARSTDIAVLGKSQLNAVVEITTRGGI